MTLKGIDNQYGRLS